MPSRPDDIGVGFHFKFECQGAVVGYFAKMSGGGSENAVIETKMVDERGKDFVKKQPGRMKYNDITLSQGITTNMSIWNWRNQVENGDDAGARKNGSITQFNHLLQPIAKWDFTNAWPSKVTIPQFQADSDAIVMEELTIVVESSKRVPV